MSSLPEYEPPAPMPASQLRALERRNSHEGWVIVGVLVAVVIWELASMPGSPETPVETTTLRVSDVVTRI